MPVTRYLTIGITENMVQALFPDGREFSGIFKNMENEALFNNVMRDVCDALYPLLKKAGHPYYAKQFKRTPQEDNEYSTSDIRLVEHTCDEHKLEVTYWQGEWSVRRSGETKTRTGDELFLLLIEERENNGK